MSNCYCIYWVVTVRLARDGLYNGGGADVKCYHSVCYQLHIVHFIQITSSRCGMLTIWSYSTRLRSFQLKDYLVLFYILFSIVVFLSVVCYSNQKGRFALFCKIWDQISFTVLLCIRVIRLTSSKIRDWSCVILIWDDKQVWDAVILL